MEVVTLAVEVDRHSAALCEVIRAVNRLFRGQNDRGPLSLRERHVVVTGVCIDTVTVALSQVQERWQALLNALAACHDDAVAPEGELRDQTLVDAFGGIEARLRASEAVMAACQRAAIGTLRTALADQPATDQQL